MAGNMLNKGAKWLQDKRDEHMSEEVVYRRRGNEIPIRATIGKTMFDLMNESGIVERVESRDFIFKRDYLIINGERTLPQEGDQIDQVMYGKTYTYRVLSLGGEPQYRFSDSFNREFRVHTKFYKSKDV